VANLDPTKIRVRDGWCIVKMDPRKAVLDSGIVLPVNELGIEKVDSGNAVVIRVGEGKKNAALGLEAGMRVALRSYLKLANPIPTAEGEYSIVSSDDIAMVLPPGVEVGVFSSPAQAGKAN
jgi:co-chaperonin GroES (HSP10)